jgi:antitoxin (DNA-binding transcriptional repressor) of toxin-antitoxin stability system
VTTREARKELCKLIATGKPTLITKHRRPVAFLLPITFGKGKTEAQKKRSTVEQTHAALAAAMKGERL